MASVIKEKNSGPLWTTLYTELRDDIITGGIRDGAKLSESYICKKYKVSRTPAREALFQLESEGLVEIIPNRGAFVTGLSNRDISDLFEMRSLLEGQAVAWAIMRMSSEDTDKLYETLDFMEFYTLKGDPLRIFEFDTHFHDMIAEGSGDRFIQNTLKTYQVYLRSFQGSHAYSQEQLKDILEEHRSIYLAFESHDAVGGRKAMEEHIRKSKARIIADYVVSRESR